MAFVFPEDKQDFKAPNGILYTYDGEKWLVKSYKEPPPPPPDLSGFVTTEDFEQDQKRQDDDIEAGYDTQSDLLLKNIEQDGRLDDIEAKDLEQDGRLDQQETKNFQQDGRLDFIDEEQGTQNSQINALETQIQLLAQVKATGTWTYERNITSSLRPPNLKKFYGTDVDGAVDNVLTDWGKLRLIMISKTSMEDKTFTFSAFEEGDKVEILAKDGTSACIGTVTNDPTNDSYGNFVVAVEYYKGGPVEGQEYLFSAYRPGANSGDVDLDILDQRYLKLTGGTLTSSLKVQRGAEKTHPQYKISPNGGGDYATNIYTLEGQMRFRTSHNDSEAAAKNSHIILDPDVANDGANPTTKIWKVVTPTSADMAANRQYVDDKTDGLATETYVDNATSGLATETYVNNATNGLATEQYVDDAVAANSGSNYELPTATTSVKGGVKAAQTSGTYVGCTIMDGEQIGVRQSSNVHKGVNYKGQACVTSNSTPSASEYQQGCLVFSTATNSLYVRT